MSAPTNWLRVKQILATALDLEPAQRGAFLREACGDDDGLHAEVQSLLAADGRAGSFAEGSPLRGLGESAVASLSRRLQGG